LAVSDELTLRLPDVVSQDVLASVTSSQTIDIYTQLIIQQATFPSIPGVPNLQQHQEAVKVTARTWRSDVRSALFNVTDVILAFSHQFDAFYDPLFEYARRLNTEEGKSAFNARMNELKTEIRQQQNKTITAGNKLKDFLDRMIEHKEIIAADNRRIAIVNDGSRGSIENIRRRINALEDSIQSDKNRYTTGTIFMAILFIIPGVNLIGPLMMDSASVAIRSKLAEKEQLHVQQSGFDSQIAHAEIVSQGVSTLTTYIGNVINATETLKTAWSQLERDYDLVSYIVSTVDPTKYLPIVQTKLSSAKTQWENLADRAMEIKRSHLVPPRNR
jgi:polyhydroxyalkanoate synthesis regulator phasin